MNDSECDAMRRAVMTRNSEKHENGILFAESARIGYF